LIPSDLRDDESGDRFEIAGAAQYAMHLPRHHIEIAARRLADPLPKSMAAFLFLARRTIISFPTRHALDHAPAMFGIASIARALLLALAFKNVGLSPVSSTFAQTRAIDLPRPRARAETPARLASESTSSARRNMFSGCELHQRPDEWDGLTARQAICNRNRQTKQKPKMRKFRAS
jgi:hypothetical protein